MRYLPPTTTLTPFLTRPLCCIAQDPVEFSRCQWPQRIPNSGTVRWNTTAILTAGTSGESTTRVAGTQTVRSGYAARLASTCCLLHAGVGDALLNRGLE